MSNEKERTLYPFQPFLIEAVRDWYTVNGWKTHITINGRLISDPVLKKYESSDGYIELNVSPQAVMGFRANEHEIHFSARFNGQPRWVTVPLEAVLFIHNAIQGDDQKIFALSPMEPLSDDNPTPAEPREPGKVIPVDFSRKR